MLKAFHLGKYIGQTQLTAPEMQEATGILRMVKRWLWCSGITHAKTPEKSTPGQRWSEGGWSLYSFQVI